MPGRPVLWAAGAARRLAVSASDGGGGIGAPGAATGCGALEQTWSRVVDGVYYSCGWSVQIPNNLVAPFGTYNAET